jgi:hypothetical protein
MSHPYLEMSDAELYDRFRDLGLPSADAKKHVELRRTNLTAKDPEATPNDPNMGALASGRIGLGQGLGGAGGALLGGAVGSLVPGPGTLIGALLGGVGGQAAIKPLTELLSRAPASDVKQQFEATTAANPGSNLVGNVLGGLIGAGVAGKVGSIGNRLATANAARTTAEATAARQPTLDKIASQRARNLELRGNLLEQRGTPAAPPGGSATPEVDLPIPQPELTADAQHAMRDFEAGKISGEDLRTALDVAAGRTPPEPAPISAGPPGSGVDLTPTPKPAPDPLDVAPQLREAPTRQVARSYKELQQLLKSGVPRKDIQVGYYTRGGLDEQSVPPTPGTTTGTLRGASYQDLMGGLQANPSGGVLREAILKEFARRGIVGKGITEP